MQHTIAVLQSNSELDAASHRGDIYIYSQHYGSVVVSFGTKENFSKNMLKPS